MGNCRIINHVGGGLYLVQPLPDFSISEADIKKLDAQVNDIDEVELVQLEAEYIDKRNETDAAKAVADASIVTYAADPTPENRKAVDEATENLGAAVVEEQKAKIPLDQVKARRTALLKRIIRISDAIGTPVPIQAWCADLSDGLKSRKIYAVDDEVGTIEILGDGSEHGINLQPNYDELGAYNGSRDGVTIPVISFVPATYFYNRAMLPPWQKWQAAYRTGVITGTSGGGFDITLDNIKSREQFDFIPVNDLDDYSLTGINAQYMNCNNAAFKVGDHVIIHTSWDVSRVRTDVIIGFVDNPQPCSLVGFSYEPFVIGGTQPGFHDWQNVRYGGGSWSMTTPVSSDVITDGTGNNMRNWKGYLDSSDKILAQWEHNGNNLYIDGVKYAVKPNFTLPAAAGDLSGPLVPTGFGSVWVTTDDQYIYAVPVESGGSRHVLRKTKVIDLTGNAYNISTDPDGWEVSAAFGPASYTDFIAFGVIHMNNSGTEGRAMDSWVHGAHRTPQTSPGAGAVWDAPGNYFSGWSEESQITITDPSASSISGAGISHQFNGLVGGGMFEVDTGYDNTIRSGKLTCPAGGTDYYLNGVRVIYGKLEYSGEYATGVGYDGDTLGYFKQVGAGTYEKTDTYTNDNACLVCTLPDISGRDETLNRTKVVTDSLAGHGVFYECDFESWSIPAFVTVTAVDSVTQTMDASACGALGQVCERTSYTESFDESVFRTGVEKSNTDDSIYRMIQHETSIQVDRSFDHSSPSGSGCAGTSTSQTTEYERGILELGATEIEHERVSNDVSSSGPIDIDIGVIAYPNMGGAYGTDPDNGPPVPVSVKTNITGYIWPASSITSRWNEQEAAKDHNDNYISWAQHQYNDLLTTEYTNFLTDGDLEALDGLDNGTGTKYLYPHPVNIS